jgi:hypothetical protein
MRLLGTATFWLVLTALAAGLAVGGSARAGLNLQAATPAAAPARAAGTPVAPAAPPSDVITLVAWYKLDPSGEFLAITPLQVDPSLLARSAPNGRAAGRADFPEDGLPSITLGDARFEAYLRYEGDENNGQRWTWFDDSEGARPATLVIQVAGTEGPYRDFYGTATFISRDEGDAGGILVLALRPPTQAPKAESGSPAAESAAEAPVATAEGDAGT